MGKVTCSWDCLLSTVEESTQDSDLLSEWRFQRVCAHWRARGASTTSLRLRVLGSFFLITFFRGSVSKKSIRRTVSLELKSTGPTSPTAGQQKRPACSGYPMLLNHGISRSMTQTWSPPVNSRASRLFSFRN